MNLSRFNPPNPPPILGRVTEPTIEMLRSGQYQLQAPQTPAERERLQYLYADVMALYAVTREQHWRDLALKIREAGTATHKGAELN